MGDKVLVVDDEQQIRDFLSTLLTMEGYEVILAASGQEALELAAEESPQMILMDISLAGIDGIEICKRLKATIETRLIPIIMMTGLGDHESDVINAGADGFISKPFETAELVFRIGSML